MSTGRPSKLTETMWKKIDSYMKDYNGEHVPTTAGLADFLKVSRSTVYYWGDNNDRFSDILDRIQTIQEKLLINNSLVGEFNATIAKLMLGKHGYSEKSQQEISGPNGGPLQHEVTHDLSRLTTEELEQLEKITAKTQRNPD
jgi:hypothetical protein